MTTAELQQPVTGTADGAGNAVITTGPTATNLQWTVSQITVNATPAAASGTGCQAAVYLNQILVCATSTGQQDVASNDPAITMAAGSQLQIQWTGCQPDTQVTALLVGTQDYPG